MAYYSRHSIFLYDNDKQKLLYLQSLIEEEELSFELREETVYQYDGEPLNMLCISDANYGHSNRNYNHLSYRAKAQQILYDYLLEKRKAGKLRP